MAFVSVVTDADLYARESGLDPSKPACLTSEEDYDAPRNAAWTQISDRLVAAGFDVDLIEDPASFREAHICLSLALIFADLSSRLNEAYGLRSEEYRRQYRAAWADTTFEYDDGETALVRKRPPRDPSVWFGR